MLTKFNNDFNFSMTIYHYRRITSALDILGVRELAHLICEYLAPIDVISLRHVNNETKHVLTDDDINIAFKVSLQEGLRLWGLTTEILQKLLYNANQCCCFLSGSFLLHTMIRDFHNIGDMDFYLIPRINRTGILTRGLRSVTKQLKQLRFLKRNGEEADGESYYEESLFEVSNFARKIAGNTRCIQLINCRNPSRLPIEIVGDFDIDIVRFYTSYTLTCPIIDLNATNYIRFYHILKRKFAMRPEYGTFNAVRRRKYADKGFTLCNCANIF